MNALSPGQWAAVDAIVSQHCPNPALIDSVKAEYDAAVAINTAHANTRNEPQDPSNTRSEEVGYDQHK